MNTTNRSPGYTPNSLPREHDLDVFPVLVPRLAPNIIGQRWGIAKFTYSEGVKGHPGDFCCEASDFGGPFFSQLFNDSADVGFVIEDFAGNEVAFVFDHLVRDGDQDVIAWVFVPVVNSLRSFLSVHILND